MKNILKVFTLINLSLISFFYVSGQVNNRYEISGRINGLQQGEKAKLILLFKDRWVDFDSCYTNKGNIMMNGTIPDGPRMVVLNFEKHLKVRPRYFVLDNEKVVVRGTISADLNQSITVEGSKGENDKIFLSGIFDVYRHAVINLKDFFSSHYFDKGKGTFLYKSQDSIEHDMELMDGLEKGQNLLKDIVKNILIGNCQNLAIPLFFTGDKEFIGNESFFPGLYSQMSDKAKNSYDGKLMQEKLYLCNGQTAPDFTSVTPEGKTITLKSITSMGKLTIVDFWASYCGSCRSEFRATVLPLYEKYHEEGLNVIGVSLDTDIERWKNAIKHDQLPWYQVCSLKGERDDPTFKLFDARLPTNVLIDENGKIIAWNVIGLELRWYLNKLFDK